MGDPKDEAAGPAVGGASWLFIVIWLFYLIIPVNDLVSGRHSTAQLVGAGIGLGAFCAGYYATVRLGFPEPAVFTGPDVRRRWLMVGLLALIALLLPILVYGELFSLWIYVSAACGFCLPMGRCWWALVGGVAATAAMTLEGYLLGASLGSLGILLLPGLFTCFGSVGARRTRLLIRELQTARAEVEQLAVTEERLRLSRDLHDLAGHSLATITLKAELARRLLHADPAAAAKQLADLEQVSRQALADIRDAVSGYRRPTLAVELLSARTALASAGVALRAGPELAGATGLDPDAEAALAWCLREATTNILRHAGAESCTAQLIAATVDGAATLTLEITDDGRGRPAGECATGREHPPGNGLTGLAERLDAVRGRLTARPVQPHGFRVTATVPVVGLVSAP
ncbi:MAG TPA: sensor histidine kinase [Actinocrinis sp.]|nr:sensor histidine kinase [Actinocrinis sp.]